MCPAYTRMPHFLYISTNFSWTCAEYAFLLLTNSAIACVSITHTISSILFWNRQNNKMQLSLYKLNKSQINIRFILLLLIIGICERDKFCLQTHTHTYWTINVNIARECVEHMTSLRVAAAAGIFIFQWIFKGIFKNHTNTLYIWTNYWHLFIIYMCVYKRFFFVSVEIRIKLRRAIYETRVQNICENV